MNHTYAGERTCQQCGIAYQPARKDARFCSAACRVRHHRGSPKADAKAASTLRSWLVKRGYASQHGRTLRLTTPVAFVLDELNGAVAGIRSRGLKSLLPDHSEESLRAALKAARITL